MSGPGAEWQALYDRLRAEHGMAGRIAGSTGIASFCTCGLAFWAATVAEADNRLTAHECSEKGQFMTSRNVT